MLRGDPGVHDMQPGRSLEGSGTTHGMTRMSIKQPSQIAAICLILSGLGCQPTATESDSVRQAMLDPPPPSEAPRAVRLANATSDARSSTAPIAAVNGVAVDRRDFVRLLVKAHGLPLLQRIILRDLARQEAARAGIKVDRADMEAEYDLTIREALGSGAAGEWSPSQRERFIDELIRMRGWSREELDIVMERQALLRRLVADRVKITPQELRIAYDREHGEKVEVRHIQMAAARQWPQIQAQLDRGEDFGRIASSYSENRASRATGGLLPPFSRGDPTVPEIFVKTAFELSPGEVSKPISFEGALHVFKLERRIPPTGVPFEQGQKALEDSLTRQMAAAEMDKLAAELMHKCELRIEDSGLREQYRAALGGRQLEGPALAMP